MKEKRIAIIIGVLAFISTIISIICVSCGKDAHDFWTATWGLIILFHIHIINYKNKVNNK